MLSVVNNLGAMNAQRQFNITGGTLSKSMEKLSSGFRINRAADDAAGLTISEKMRSQIRGLNQGSDNIQDGIHLIQIADGGLDEVCGMLHRLNELSVKSLNDTNTMADREAMQAEVEQIIEEINKVAETTEYNTLKLLQGKFSDIVDYETEKKITSMIPAQVPSWVDVQTSMSTDNYDADTMGSLTQRTDLGRYLEHGRDSNGNEKNYVYYGPEGSFNANQNDRYGNAVTYSNEGTWSTGLSDNIVSKVSFESLKDVSDADELYNKVSDLLGSAISVRYVDSYGYSGILFSGTLKGKSVADDAQVRVNNTVVSTSSINLTDAAVMTTANGCSRNYDPQTVIGAIESLRNNASLSVSEKVEQTRTLADDIGRALTKYTIGAVNRGSGSSNQNVYTAQTDDYSFIFYDLRDQSKLTATVPSSEVNTSANVMTGHFEYEHYIDIQCSSNADDRITVELPDMHPEKLDITGYNVADYGQQTITYYEREYYEAYSYERRITEPYTYYDDLGRKQTGYRDTGRTETINVPAGYRNVRKQRVEYGVYKRPDISRVQKTLDYVLDARQKLGATQNRLEYSYNNNMNKAENTTAAESRIRDTDMSKEMMKFTTANILSQAGSAMLSQTMQNPQSVLQLLQ